MEEDTSKIRDTTRSDLILGSSIVLPIWISIMFNGYSLRACGNLRIVQKIRFCHIEFWWTEPWCPGSASRPSAKAYEPVAEVQGLLFITQNSQLVHILSFFPRVWFSHSDNPRFRAPWKKIRQKYETQQDPS